MSGDDEGKIWLPFNINQYVKVRLTDHGRELHRRLHDELMEKLRLVYANWKSSGYDPTKEDADGWSEWQAWVLMQTFGPHVYNGCKPCFETIIQVGLDEQKRASTFPATVTRRVPEGTRDLDMEEESA